MMVVPVLMTSCHVLLKWKMGPVAAHASTRARAARNAWGLPVARAVALEQTVKKLAVLMGLIRESYRTFRSLRREQGSDGSATRAGLLSRS